MIRYYQPTSIGDARTQLLTYGDAAHLVGGGTALALFLRQDLIHPAVLIGTGGIPGLGGIERTASGGLMIGAAVPLRKLEGDQRLIDGWPLIAQAIRSVATPRIRNMIRIGGVCAQADPAQDPPVAFSAAGATLVVAGANERRIPIQAFYRGYFENALLPGELITHLELPPLPPRAGSVYLKFLPRSVDDYGVVTAAAIVGLDDKRRCTFARLALGAVADRPIIVDVETALQGALVDERAARAAAELARELVDPMDDVRGSADYKRKMAVVFARRALLEAASVTV